MKNNFFGPNVIKVRGARENNLQNLNIDIPKNKLVVITGVSGSGKSSLAFDTIYAEGQRRYLESLSSYARQFLGNNEKPDVDSIEGLSPSISIDQKTTSHNPRSTVGTVTEIYDYLRLIYARIGKPYCINNHGVIESQSIKQMTDKIVENEEGSKILILAPFASNAKGSFRSEFEKLKKDGFLRIRVNKKIENLDEITELDKAHKHTIEVVIDRIMLDKTPETRSRIFNSIEAGLKISKGVVITVINDTEQVFNEKFLCNVCGFSIPELEPKFFSFNSPLGACEHCKGLGFSYEVDEDLMIPNRELSIFEGGIEYYKNIIFTPALEWQILETLLNHYKIPGNIPVKNLKQEHIDLIMNGTKEAISYTLISANGNRYSKFEPIEGVGQMIKRRHLETTSESAREYYSKYMLEKMCKECNGDRLNPAALSIKVNNLNISQLTQKSISEILAFFLKVDLSEEQRKIAELALQEIINRLSFLENVGLDYLNLARAAGTLSGGESQRIRLATQIGSQLTNVLYVLDEPSIGLHQKDNDKLIATLKKMRDLGNSLLVVEHDEDTMMASDHLIDIGPGAGKQGGTLVSEGTPKEVMADHNSLTGDYLSGRKYIPVPVKRRAGNGYVVELKGAASNNLQNVDVSFPLNKLIVVTGVSGSGKSSLINETLVKAIERRLNNPFIRPGKHKEIKGLHHVDKIVKVSQDPIGRTPRSNPSTYAGVFDDIRDVFAMTAEAKARGYQKGRFSFNVRGGRCERCQGDGVLKIEMHFLPDVFVNCEDCQGRRYNEETLQVKFKGSSIYDVLQMTVDTAAEFFKSFPDISKKLTLMQRVGLGYIQLGASAVSLSGGEAQRVKLAKFLQRRPTGKTIFCLDEPTTGLHIDDVARLIKVINGIVDAGDSVIIIEHNLEVIKVADYIIDLGPDGGNKGGKIIATGTPEQIVAQAPYSYTGQYLKKILEKGNYE